MKNLLRHRWAPYVLLGLAATSMAAVFAVVALRDDGGLDPTVKKNLRGEIEDAITTQLAALLQVSQPEVKELYDDKRLEEAGEELGLSVQDILRTGQAAARIVLEEAVDAGTFSERQVENTEQIVLRQLRRHL